MLRNIMKWLIRANIISNYTLDLQSTVTILLVNVFYYEHDADNSFLFIYEDQNMRLKYYHFNPYTSMPI